MSEAKEKYYDLKKQADKCFEGLRDPIHDYVTELEQELIKLKESQTQWISVKDRLPEDAMLYLCFGEIWYNKNIQQEFIRVVKYKNCKFICDFNPCAYVTHWMPLPEKPDAL